MINNIAIIGSAGAIGSAFTLHFSQYYPNASIHAFSRNSSAVNHENVISHLIDYESEDSIEQAALLSSKTAPLDIVIVATGILHNDTLQPEKSLKDISEEKFNTLFKVNTIVPALVAKHFTSKLNKKNQSLFAALSARVGSISDNQLGGWYAYRASKAALNMIIKTTAIEIKRQNETAVVVGLHPGTVDSNLSKPFQSNVPESKLFTPEFSVSKMINVLEGLSPEDSGRCFAWDGTEINP